MAGNQGRAKRKQGVETEVLFARVSPEHVAQARATAKVLGIGLGEYIDHLLEREKRQIDHRFRPRWWRGPLAADQTQLPLATEEAPLPSA
jgi:hypothetical protein